MSTQPSRWDLSWARGQGGCERNGGVLHPAHRITLPQHELSDHQFVPLDELPYYLAPHQLNRVRTAVRNALNGHRAAYIAGHPA
ncbi:hypothetical protein E0L36_19765 [Streptomyces sp. AJS327]|uniref:hypothetical protein n=1 Tax=Streptomyces sp. AJS327 TaxID=2545265 RepID=UPI0015DFE910|nr:hypothetical protein [Streptomyces sp. AJS327]MBA0053029.1 hypothetical protein [Streptomyces sp. AJS327]